MDNPNHAVVRNLSPVYVFDNGNPQSSHHVMAMAIGLALLGCNSPTGLLGELKRRVFWFACVVTVVTFVWFIVALGDAPVEPPLYIFFNYLVVRTAFATYSALGDRFVRAVAYTPCRRYSRRWY